MTAGGIDPGNRPSDAASQRLPPRRVDVVVVHYRAPKVILECLAPLVEAARGTDLLTVTVVDNDREVPARDAELLLDGLAAGRYVRRASNDGFGVASNVGANQGSSPAILFLNPDCVIRAEDVVALAEALDGDAGVVAVGPRLRRPDGVPEISWAEHPGFLWEIRRRRLWRALAAGRPWALAEAERRVAHARDVDWLTAACMLVRRDAFQRVRGFDPDYFLYFEDADLGLRLGRLGRLRFDPRATAIHVGGTSSADAPRGPLDPYRVAQLTYYRKHRPRWEQIALAAWRRLRP